MKIQRKIYVVMTVLVIGIILAVWGRIADRGLVTGLGLILIVCGLVGEVTVKRCPFCGAYLGRYYTPGSYCSECGKKVD